MLLSSQEHKGRLCKQCDQTWQNFSTLSKFLKYLVILKGFILYLANF